jgi:predicted O-methyltransferase YrrM
VSSFNPGTEILQGGKYFFDFSQHEPFVPGFLKHGEAALLRYCVDYVAAIARAPVIVEVGSWKGRSAVAIGDILRRLSRGKLYAVDPHQGDRGVANRTAEPTLKAFLKNVKAFGLDDVVIPLVCETKDVLWKIPVDMVFVDGLHDYENVKRDFDTFDPHLKLGGLVCFHDYGRRALPDVTRFVHEVLARDEYAQLFRHLSVFVVQKAPERATERRS